MNDIRRIPMEEWVEGLRQVPEDEFTSENILRKMTGLLLDKKSLEPYVHFLDERYTRNKVFRNELFEVIVLCWGVGHQTPIHNHDNQLGWATVQQGILSLQNFRRVGCAMGGPGEDPVRCKAGSLAPVILEETDRVDIASVGAITTVDRKDTIHQISNHPAFGEPAISVHVYSKPIDSCVVYDLEKRSCKRVQLAYHTEHGQAVAPA